MNKHEIKESFVFTWKNKLTPSCLEKRRRNHMLVNACSCLADLVYLF